MVLMALPFVSIPCTSAFSGVRYPVGYNPDLRLRPNYYPNTPLKPFGVGKKWSPPIGYDPKSWNTKNTKDDEDLYMDYINYTDYTGNTDDTDNTDNTDDTDYTDDIDYTDNTYIDTDSYANYDDIKFKHGKYIVEGVWVGRAILKAHETISFDDIS